MTATLRPAFEFFGDWTGRVVAATIHAGHDVREEIAAQMILDDDVRLREEDPYTEAIASRIPSRVVMRRSRFEVDLNRPRDQAVYREPSDCWGLDVWREPPLDEDLTRGSLAVYDEFFAALAARLDPIAERGPFVLFDIHSYNHRRNGEGSEPAPQRDNPDVNVGTKTVDRETFGPLVDSFIATLGAVDLPDGRLDVRENVAFRGAHLAAWTHERYPGRACALALEFKKTFMDEWTGERDDERIAQLAAALEHTVPALERELTALGNLR